MCQKVFNIYNSILRKTESRATAEWSYRSTICFAMANAVSHFLPNVKPSEYHRKKKEVEEDGRELWDFVEREHYKIINKTSEEGTVPCIPILPNLITSTGETTIHATPSKIFDQKRIYLVACPTAVKNENVDSGKCNNYSTEESGDSHTRGVRIVLNTTFTGGGLSAPIFAVVYGLTPDELPNGDEILTIPIPGLIVGAERNIYLTKEGYLVFVRGNYDKESNTDEVDQATHPDSNDIEDEELTVDEEQIENLSSYSKEVRVACLYRMLVYHPFISFSTYLWTSTLRVDQFSKGMIFPAKTNIGQRFSHLKHK